MRGPVNTPIKLTIVRKGQDKPLEVKLDARRHPHPLGALAHRGDDVGYIRITQFNEQTFEGLKTAIDKLSSRDRRRQAQGLRPRPAQQSRRPARPGDRGLRRLPRPRRDRLDPRPQRRGDPALQRPAGDLTKGKPVDRADQRRLGLGLRDRRRRAAGPQARDHHRHALVRQGLGADDHPARLGNGALRLTTARYYTPSGRSIQAKGIDPGHRGPAGRAGRAEGHATEHQGRGAPARPSEERRATSRPARRPTSRRTPRTTSSSIRPYDLLRGVKVNATAPALQPTRHRDRQAGDQGRQLSIRVGSLRIARGRPSGRPVLRAVRLIFRADRVPSPDVRLHRRMVWLAAPLIRRGSRP